MEINYTIGKHWDEIIKREREREKLGTKEAQTTGRRLVL